MTNFLQLKFFFLGDFNLHGMWEVTTTYGNYLLMVTSIPNLSPNEIECLEIAAQYSSLFNFYQINSVVNEFGSLLDLVFVQDPDIVV